jgi:anti-sigma B factor antagonist
MAFQIESHKREGILILVLSGRLMLGEAATLLRDRLAKAADAGSHRLVLNLKAVEHIDSTGLGTLVMAATRAKKAGGAAKLAFLNQKNLELMVMTKLTTVFEIFNDEVDAVNSFFPDRKIERFDILEFVKRK